MMTRLWSRMLALYGRQWEVSYGHVGGAVFGEWSTALANIEPMKIKRGLDAVIEEGSEFPPNLIKFLRLCRTPSYNAPGYHANQTALPKPNVHKDPKVKTAKEQAFAEWGNLNNFKPKERP